MNEYSQVKIEEQHRLKFSYQNYDKSSFKLFDRVKTERARSIKMIKSLVNRPLHQTRSSFHALQWINILFQLILH